MKRLEFSGVETPPTRMYLSCWGSARLNRALLKKKKKKRTWKETAAPVSCFVVSENIFYIFRIFFSWWYNSSFSRVNMFIIMATSEEGKKNCFGCISVFRWLWNTDELLFTPVCRPPPSLYQVLPKQSLCKFLVQFPARYFLLEFTKEVNRKMVPPIFLFDVGETS